MHQFHLPKPLKRLSDSNRGDTRLKPDLCLAPKARTYTSLGQRPRKRAIYHLSAESAVHRGDRSSFITKMERAFSPEFIGWHLTWGVAPGWYEPRLWR